MEAGQAASADKGQKPSETYILMRWLYLRLLGVIYLSAFASYAVMILGLNGSEGILPTKDLLESVRDQFGANCVWVMPTLAWINSSDTFLQGIAWTGTVLSFLVILGIATGPVLVILMVLWLSLVTGGGEFTGFQSDGMLIEATFLTLFMVPWSLFEPPWPVPPALLSQKAPAPAAIWLLRFMIFRMMFASGLVKILSGDATWADFTALQYHFETQPIPTPLAWYAHNLPAWMLKASVAGTFASELVAPLLIFAPRPFRIAGAGLIILLHSLIALTGNYTFLSFLAILLCIPLLDDRLLRPVFPKRVASTIENSQQTRSPGRLRRLALNTVAAILIVLAANVFIGTVLGRTAQPQPIRAILIWLSPFRIMDSYGLFAVMTTKRPELVFEGSNDGKTWLSYEFLYKPGDNLKRPPPWVEPHMPRLDWRLWFAAMEPVEGSPWVLNLVNRLLEGSPQMKQFFERDPFPDKPPKYMRAFVYDYHFTDPATKAATGCWWRRDNQNLYLPPVLLKDGKLIMADL